VACRRVTGETFLDLDNADYVTEHWSLSIYNDPQRFGRLENRSSHWLNSGEWSDEGYPCTQATTPVWDAGLPINIYITFPGWTRHHASK
jgi:hypothetical protein